MPCVLACVRQQPLGPQSLGYLNQIKLFCNAIRTDIAANPTSVIEFTKLIALNALIRSWTLRSIPEVREG